jgi:hypothetical protein
MHTQPKLTHRATDSPLSTHQPFARLPSVATDTPTFIDEAGLHPVDSTSPQAYVDFAQHMKQNFPQDMQRNLNIKSVALQSKAGDKPVEILKGLLNLLYESTMPDFDELLAGKPQGA